MKNLISLIACGIICLVLIQYRVASIPSDRPLKVTEWDALGYYIYLPSILIYHDFKKLDWLAAVDKQYSVSGGTGWPARKLDNGNYT